MLAFSPRRSRSGHTFLILLGCSLLVAAGTSGTSGPFAAGARPAHGAPQLTWLGSAQPFSLESILPGDSRQGLIEIRNDGSGRGELYILAESRGSSALAARLAVEVTRQGQMLYSGSLAGLGRVAAGELAPGRTAVLKLRLRFPSGADDAQLQGLALATSFIVTAVQA